MLSSMSSNKKSFPGIELEFELEYNLTAKRHQIISHTRYLAHNSDLSNNHPLMHCFAVAVVLCVIAFVFWYLYCVRATRALPPEAAAAAGGEGDLPVARAAAEPKTPVYAAALQQITVTVPDDAPADGGGNKTPPIYFRSIEARGGGGNDVASGSDPFVPAYTVDGIDKGPSGPHDEPPRFLPDVAAAAGASSYVEVVSTDDISLRKESPKTVSQLVARFEEEAALQSRASGDAALHSRASGDAVTPSKAGGTPAVARSDEASASDAAGVPAERGSVGFFLSALTGSPSLTGREPAGSPRTPGSPSHQHAGRSRIPGYTPDTGGEGGTAGGPEGGSGGVGSTTRPRRSSMDSPSMAGGGSGGRWMGGSTGSGGGSLATMQDGAVSERERGWKVPSAHPPENPRVFLNTPAGDSALGGGCGSGAVHSRRSTTESPSESYFLPLPPPPSDPSKPAWRLPNAHPNIIGTNIGTPSRTARVSVEDRQRAAAPSPRQGSEHEGGPGAASGGK